MTFCIHDAKSNKSLPDPKVLPAAAAALPAVGTPARVELLKLLADRRAITERGAVIARLGDDDASVRRQAVKALGVLAGPPELPRLIDILVKAGTDAERSAARQAVVAISRQVAKPEERAGPLLAALAGARGEGRRELLAALAEVGGERALATVVAETKAQDQERQDAGIRALAGWHDIGAAEELLKLSRNVTKLRHHVLAMRGYVRLVAAAKLPPEKKVGMYEEAMAAARRHEEKKLVLGALGDVRSLPSLQLAAASLKDTALQAEAAAAAVRIACPRDSKDKGLRAPAVAAVLKTVLAVSKGADLKKKAKSHLKALTPVQDLAKSPPPLGYPDEEGFVSLFNGRDLTGWVGSIKGYGAADGALFCKPDSGGKLFTAHEFSDFILRFDFKLSPGANNGLAIRSPLRGNPAYSGMELQIIDDTAEKYAGLRPYQYHGSIYGVVPARRGHLKPVGQWNAQEVRAVGPRVTVILNGVTIVDADLSKIARTADGKGIKGHPGLRRTTGHIGWLGHRTRVEFRNIRIKPVLPDYENGPHNVPPEGFTALFNGSDLTGWQGLVGNPKSRAKMSATALADARAKAWAEVLKHWKVIDGQIVNDGGGPHLCTSKDYADFELLVDYKTVPKADSGIYLRGTPQVQIWDTTKEGGKWRLGASCGSGGLWNNRKHARMPLIHADKPFGQWNRLRIRMIGDRVTVWLNGQMTVKDTVMENYWERNKPIYETGPIELQTHGGEIRWRNIFIRAIPRT